MKRIALAILFSVVAIVCHGQSFGCPASSSPAYELIYSPTLLTYTDTPDPGTYCYFVESTIGDLSSDPSGVAGPYTISSSTEVVLTWDAPDSGPTPTGYAVYRAPAIATSNAVLVFWWSY